MIMSIFVSFVIWNFFGSICGIPDFGIGMALCCDANRASTEIAFAAAPLKTKLMVPGFQLALFRLTSPPEYSNVTFSKTQLSHSKPSSWTVAFLNTIPLIEKLANGGIVGTKPDSKATPGLCARVDVYVNKSKQPQNNIVMQPNDEVILRITPPLDENSSEQCTITYYHYPEEQTQTDALSPSLKEIL
jgi:hypothetical protein